MIISRGSRPDRASLTIISGIHRTSDRLGVHRVDLADPACWNRRHGIPSADGCRAARRRRLDHPPEDEAVLRRTAPDVCRRSSRGGGEALVEPASVAEAVPVDAAFASPSLDGGAQDRASRGHAWIVPRQREQLLALRCLGVARCRWSWWRRWPPPLLARPALCCRCRSAGCAGAWLRSRLRDLHRASL